MANFANLRDAEKAHQRVRDGVDSVFPKLPSYAVAGLPTAGDHSGKMAYVTDGASGNPILAFSNSAFWARSDTGSAVSAGA